MQRPHRRNFDSCVSFPEISGIKLVRSLIPEMSCANGHDSGRYENQRDDGSRECIECRRLKNKRAYQSKLQRNPIQLMRETVKNRAKQRGIPFDLSVEDILAAWPADNICPILRLPLIRGVGVHHPQSPSIDRVRSKLGYVRGNIAIISRHANVIKQDCDDPEVFVRIAEYLRERL